MLLDALVLTLLVALAAGGRPSRLTEIALRGTALFLVAAAARIGMMAVQGAHLPFASRLGPALLIASYLVLLGALGANRRLWPLSVVLVGVLLNALVIAANGGSMPADRALTVRAYGSGAPLVRLLDSPAYTVHKPVGPETRLRFLGDVLPLPMYPPRPKWFCPGSAGDVLITFGACAMLLWGMGAFGLRGRGRGDRGRNAECGMTRARNDEHEIRNDPESGAVSVDCGVGRLDGARPFTPHSRQSALRIPHSALI